MEEVHTLLSVTESSMRDHQTAASENNGAQPSTNVATAGTLQKVPVDMEYGAGLSELVKWPKRIM